MQLPPPPSPLKNPSQPSANLSLLLSCTVGEPVTRLVTCGWPLQNERQIPLQGRFAELSLAGAALELRPSPPYIFRAGTS